MSAVLYAVTDNGGDTLDRFSLWFMSDDGPFVYGASEYPFHPCGFGQYCGDLSIDTDDYDGEVGDLVDQYTLPEDVQRLINQIEAG